MKFSNVTYGVGRMFLFPSVLGGWSPWTTWSICSDNSCNDGLQSRSRRCDLPLPSDRSFYCNGTSMEIKPFNSTLYTGKHLKTL